MSTTTVPTELEKLTIKRITRRIIPFLLVLYLINFLDRTNVGFAALQMNEDIGITQAVYGLGAGIFFLAYFVFEVPSNVLLHRFGARMWIARIMVTWGIVAAAMAFIQVPAHFLTLRVLLGIAEAGFFPGVIFYLSLWFPASYRARMASLFYLGIPVAQVIGAPISTGLMVLGNTMGFDGWRIMYFIEGLPAIALGVVCFFYLTDSPSKATWLPAEQRAWLIQTLEREEAAIPAATGPSVSKGAQIWKALSNKYVLILSVIYFGITFGTNAMNFFLPSVLQSFGDTFGVELGIMETGLIIAIPYAAAAVAMVIWARRSDKRRERRVHTASAAIVASIAITVALLIDTPVIIVIGFVVMAAGLYSAISVFWSIPTQFLTGVGAAVGIGLINSVGNLSGFVGPFATGALHDATGNYTASFLVVAAVVGLAGLAMLGLRTHHLGEPPAITGGDEAPDPADRIPLDAHA